MHRSSRMGHWMARAIGIGEHGMPTGLRARAVVAAHLARRGSARASLGSLPRALRSFVAEAVFFEIARRNFGWNSMIRGRAGFFPHIFMPDYDGPYFDEAMRRLVFPKRGPNILYFSLTGTCPYHCEYCFAGAVGDAPDIGDEGVFSVAREVARLRVPLVNISGGEPFVRYERLLRAVELLAEGSEVRVFTTGFGVTAERLVELRNAGLKGVFVSLDGDDGEVFDERRGRRGAFRDAVKALQACAEAEMLTFVNTVVGPSRFSTADDVANFLQFVERIDPRIVVNFLPQLATGRGAEADSFRTPADCHQVAERIVTTAARMGRPVSMLFGRVDTFIGCPGAGGKLMNIDIEGNVTVCISRGSLGNILRDPFEEVYRRFASECDRLKIGFFCCDVASEHGALLDAEQTRAALDAFFRHPDADWQRVIDAWPGVLRWLFEEPVQ